ncbi:MAG TPA: T9SS type A sorting domain-containing protein [Sediminibacterium sp.]|nr:T9SS type A sorting domain-containing protein [Sediminibacterium sp.]
MTEKNKYRLLGSIFWVLFLVAQQLNAQCVFVSLTGPKCTTDGNLIGTFSRNPYKLEWLYNGKVIQTATAKWTSVSVTPVGGNISTGSQKKITGTGGIAIDPSGAVVVSDTLNQRIVSFSKNNPDGINMAAGNGTGSGSNQLNKPAGIFIDAFGNLFIADQLNHRVLRFAPGSNTGFLVAGGNGAGNGAAQLNSPKDLFVDANGYVYIADAGNHRIQKWAQGGAVGETVAGGNGPGSDSLRLNSPQGVCVDRFSNVYVADSANHRIQKFLPGSLKGITVAGGNGRGTYAAQLNQPVDVWVDGSGNIYVLDAGNHRVQRWTPDALSVTTIAGSEAGTGGSSGDLLDTPSAFSFDASGNLFILDQNNHRVQQYSTIPLSTTYTADYQGTYSANAYSFTGCMQTANSLFILANLPIQVSGNTAVCKGDTALVKLIGPGNYTFTPGTGITKLNDSVYRFLTDTTTVFNISSTNINGCTTTASATITVGSRILPFIKATDCVSPASSAITTRIQGGIPAALVWYVNNTTGGVKYPSWLPDAEVAAGGNGTGATAAQLNFPSGVFVDHKNNVYVADPLNHRIQLWKPGDIVGTTIAGGNGAGSGMDQLNYPTGVYADVQGNIYVADQNNHRIQYFRSGSTIAKTIAGTQGQGASLSQLNFPAGVFVDNSGSVYIADAGNHRVLRIAADGKTISTVAGTGEAGSYNNQLNNPQAVYVDRNYNVYVADAGNHRVVYFIKGYEFGVVVAGGNGVGFSAKQLSSPSGVLADALGNLYIADKGNNRIQRWAAFDTVGVTIAGSENGNAGSGKHQLNLPSALAFDLTGGLYAADARNNRVQKFILTGVSLDSVIKTTVTGQYAVQAYAFNGCVTGSEFVRLRVTTPVILKAGSTALCEGTGVAVKASADAAGTFTWSPAAGLRMISNDSVLASPVVTTRYTVSTTLSNGCVSSSNITLRVHPLPVANVNGPTCVGGEDLTVKTTVKFRSVNWEYNSTPLYSGSTLWKKGATIVAGSIVPGIDASKFSRPTFVFVDDKGALYVCDQWNHRIQKWMQGATSGTTVAGGNGPGSNANQLKNPSAIYVDNRGVIYIADTDNDRIQRWAPGDTTGTTVAGGNGRGNKPDQLSYPAGVFVDAYDHIYIADAINSRVQKWTPNASAGITVAGGQFAGNDSTQLNTPLGVFVDAAGNLYVADTQNDRIQKWAQDARYGVTVAGGNGKGNNANQVVTPMNVFVDDSNWMYIAEGGTANRIKQWLLGSNEGRVIAGGGSPGSGAEQLNAPGNAMIDVNGSLFVSDMNNFRVQRFSLADTMFAVKPPDKGAFRFTATSFAGCTIATQEHHMDTGYIPAPPSVADVALCFKSPALPLKAAGDSLIWYTGGTGGIGDTAAPTPNTMLVGTTSYWVARTNALKTCESKRLRIAVTVHALPGASLKIALNPSILPGDTSILVAKPDSANIARKYSWYRNNIPVSGLPDLKDSLKVFYGGVGTYYVQVSDSNNCTSQSAEVEVKAEIAQNQNVYLFPNPVQTTTRLIFTPVPNAVTYVKLINLSGVVLMNKKIATAATGNTVYNLDLSAMPKGVYDVQVLTGPGKMIGTRRILKL